VDRMSMKTERKSPQADPLPSQIPSGCSICTMKATCVTSRATRTR
jgi:hypothetical protein